LTRRSLIWTATLVLLGLSLAGNFFLLGYAAHGLRPDGAGRVLMTEIARAYPPEVRKEFRSIRRANRPRTMAALHELRMARAKLAAAQQASPFDEAAVKDAMTAVRTATTNLQATMQEYLLTALKNIKAKPAAGS
jgi:uncharacterized membrane protein